MWGHILALSSETLKEENCIRQKKIWKFLVWMMRFVHMTSFNRCRETLIIQRWRVFCSCIKQWENYNIIELKLHEDTWNIKCVVTWCCSVASVFKLMRQLPRKFIIRFEQHTTDSILRLRPNWIMFSFRTKKKFSTIFQTLCAWEEEKRCSFYMASTPQWSTFYTFKLPSHAVEHSAQLNFMILIKFKLRFRVHIFSTLSLSLTLSCLVPVGSIGLSSNDN